MWFPSLFLHVSPIFQIRIFHPFCLMMLPWNLPIPDSGSFQGLLLPSMPRRRAAIIRRRLFCHATQRMEQWINNPGGCLLLSFVFGFSSTVWGYHCSVMGILLTSELGIPHGTKRTGGVRKEVYPRIDYRTITGVEAVLGDKGAVLGDKGGLEWELTSSFKMFSDRIFMGIFMGVQAARWYYGYMWGYYFWVLRITTSNSCGWSAVGRAVFWNLAAGTFGDHGECEISHLRQGP